MPLNTSLFTPRLSFSEKTLSLPYRSFLIATTAVRKAGLLVLSVFILLLTFSPIAGAGARGAKKGPPPLVKVTPIIEQEINPPIEYVGHVEAIQSVVLQARVKGFLEQVNFKEGSNVQIGDLLYVIEQAPYQARVAANQAGVAQARATLTKTSQYLKRVRNVRSGGISASDLDTAVAEELLAKARLLEAQAALKLSELDLEYTKIRAPISGRIGRTALTRGNLCEPNFGPLARIVQLNPIRVLYSISENDLTAIQATLKDSSDQKKIRSLVPQIKLLNDKVLGNSGQIDFIDNVVDRETGTISVRAVFDNSKGLLLPGQYVTIMISQNQGEKLPVIPQAAVLQDREGRYVLVVNQLNQVVKQRITTGSLVSSNRWAVTSGLKVGELVITQGLQKVKPGQTVKTTQDEPQN
ncbi:MAG: efflux RND transporter periplasmic adaptor subunit [Deltaproteobacteria bacterium]|nr:efflux RND transporter periplasmic adaptor subunit [Candidatus Tharpella aukensis]